MKNNQSFKKKDKFLHSLKTYFVLLRFVSLSFVTAIVDYLIFFIAHFYGCGILLSQIMARAVAIIFNYPLAKNAVFDASNSNKQAFPKYLSLVVINGLIAYGLIKFFISEFALHVLLAKMLSELIIYFANFLIQQKLIFNQHKPDKTDWDSYYEKPYRTASFTRKITEKNLHRYIDSAKANASSFSIAELGGANSCFYLGIKKKFQPQKYLIVDNNQLGLNKFKERVQDQQVALYHQNALQLEMNEQADIVFSVGLIEHFSPEQMRKVIASHFELVKPGGAVIISFPTPTFLYKITRTIAELMRLWIFHDERPLPVAEVGQIVKQHGILLQGKIIWPIFLTQYMMLIRKN